MFADNAPVRWYEEQFFRITSSNARLRNYANVYLYVYDSEHFMKNNCYFRCDINDNQCELGIYEKVNDIVHAELFF